MRDKWELLVLRIKEEREELFKLECLVESKKRYIEELEEELERVVGGKSGR
ncbi:MAG: hypothetical protein ACRDDY_04270 [Clostridium sp.]|uniref:hypothetical protein n=1 Tax=Clostridium sp. TaxID=1506 RepID=UPI003EE7423E